MHFVAEGLRLRDATIVAAPLIAVPRSTKNRSGQREAQMHQTTKGKQWYFAIKVHSGVDDTSGLVLRIYCLTAHLIVVTQEDRLLDRVEDTVCGAARNRGG